MAPGVGAAGIMGIAIEQLSAPTQSALATATTGGTILAGTYIYAVTAINANGETTRSNEQTIITSGSTSTVTVTWVAVPGATGYKLYKTAAGGATGTELLYKTVGVVTTDTDTAPGAPSGALPTTNTALTPGTYTAPTKFVPFMSENLSSVQSTIWRRPIRQSADVVGAVPGNFHVAGDISIECMEDVSIYFMYASRVTIVRSGTSPNFIYTITPSPAATPVRTLSITVVRNGIVFGFTGCVVATNTFSVKDGLLMQDIKIVGRDEVVQTLPTATWPATVPFGAGQYSIEIPTGSPVLDTDNFSLALEDNADPQYRLKNTGRGAAFIKFGERNVNLSFDRDFDTRTDFDNFKALTAQDITITASKTANNSVSFQVPVTIKDTYDVNNSGQGDLIRASIKYKGVLDSLGKSYQMVLKTQEQI